MRLGLFMMPLHDPARDYLSVLKEDREAILLADRLGYDEAWVGEHYSCKTEPIPDPLAVHGNADPLTKHIVFATGVINLPQHNPAQVAGNVALFDHLAEGRYIMGVGPGGLGSDFELFETFEKNRAEMMVESVRMIHEILALRPAIPHPRQVLERRRRQAGAGAHRRRADAEALPEALSAAGGLGDEPGVLDRKARGRTRLGSGVREFYAEQSGPDPLASLRRGRGGRRQAPRSRARRVARSIVCTETDQEAADYLADEKCSPGWYYEYLRDNLATYKMTKIFKPDQSMSDAELTVPKMLEMMVISGSPRRVLDKLVALVDEIGWFGTLLVTHKDWDKPDLHRGSMRLIAEQVMPRLGQHMATKQAAD